MRIKPFVPRKLPPDSQTSTLSTPGSPVPNPTLPPMPPWIAPGGATCQAKSTSVLSSPSCSVSVWPKGMTYAMGSVHQQGLAAAIYTQLAEVENEFDGYLAYDRARPKMNERRISKAHRALCRALG